MGPPEQQWYSHYMYKYNLITHFRSSLILIREMAFLLFPITIISHFNSNFAHWHRHASIFFDDLFDKNSFLSHSLYFRFETFPCLLQSTKQSLYAWFILAKSMVLQAETVYIINYLECEHAGLNGVKYRRSTIQGSITKSNQQVFLPRGAERVRKHR